MPRYTVQCGDAHQVFQFGSTWTDTSLQKRLSELLRRVEVAPGLVLQDESGSLWKPKLLVELVKVKPEE